MISVPFMLTWNVLVWREEWVMGKHRHTGTCVSYWYYLADVTLHVPTYVASPDADWETLIPLGGRVGGMPLVEGLGGMGGTPGSEEKAGYMYLRQSTCMHWHDRLKLWKLMTQLSKEGRACWNVCRGRYVYHMTIFTRPHEAGQQHFVHQSKFQKYICFLALCHVPHQSQN